MKLETPEEQEIEKRKLLLLSLEQEAVEKELSYENLTIGIILFEQHYANVIGKLYAELDQLIATIEAYNARLYGTTEAYERAEDAAERARQSAYEAGISENTTYSSDTSELDLIEKSHSPELKLLYRKAAMRYHPDRASGDEDRHRRTEIMSKLNSAYDNNDEAAIKSLLMSANSDPREICGDDFGSQIIRMIRREAQLRKRMEEIDSDIQSLQEQEIYQLWQKIAEAEKVGLDPLKELTTKILVEIAEKKVELQDLEVNV